MNNPLSFEVNVVWKLQIINFGAWNFENLETMLYLLSKGLLRTPKGEKPVINKIALLHSL